MKRSALAVGAWLLLTTSVAADVRMPGPASLIPPVDGAVAVRFAAPDGPYARGHRGIDYAVVEGTAVRAAAAGTVTFAGPVGEMRAVTIDHGAGVATTYSSLDEIYVAPGDRVDEGRWIGTVAEAHPGGDGGLHFGVKVEGVYVDPEIHLGTTDVSDAIYLVPLSDDGPARSGCTEAMPIDGRPPRPNDNVVVAIAGIGSQTTEEGSTGILDSAPSTLGYPRRLVYEFSYAGVDDGDLHRPYERADTYQALSVPAARLRDLLVRIGRRHPGRGVDLIAHSQGGIVARAALGLAARSFDRRMPAIEHLVTFATPHRGAPLADAIVRIDDHTLTGGAVRDVASWWSKHGGTLPDPKAPAVRQLAPGSGLQRRLAAEDMLFGTRVLALGIANDVVVPADRAVYPGELSRTVPVHGWNGHSTIVGSPAAHALAYAFLRDADPPCSTAVDRWGRWAGSAIGWAETKIPWLYSQIERAARGGAASAMMRAGRRVGATAWRVTRDAAVRAGRGVATVGREVFAVGEDALGGLGRLLRRADPRRW